MLAAASGRRIRLQQSWVFRTSEKLVFFFSYLPDAVPATPARLAAGDGKRAIGGRDLSRSPEPTVNRNLIQARCAGIHPPTWSGSATGTGPRLIWTQVTSSRPPSRIQRRLLDEHRDRGSSIRNAPAAPPRFQCRRPPLSAASISSSISWRVRARPGVARVSDPDLRARLTRLRPVPPREGLRRALRPLPGPVPGRRPAPKRRFTRSPTTSAPLSPRVACCSS